METGERKLGFGGSFWGWLPVFWSSNPSVHDLRGLEYRVPQTDLRIILAILKPVHHTIPTDPYISMAFSMLFHLFLSYWENIP